MGCNDDGSTIQHDPNDEANLVSGGHLNHSGGRVIAYSNRNWLPRWAVECAASGTCILVKPG